jgi:hypothetical protein
MAAKPIITLTPNGFVLSRSKDVARPEPPAPRPMDERCYCRFALRGDRTGAASCPEFRPARPGQRSWCGLNGAERKSPCAFDEPATAEIWQRIGAYLGEARAKGWPVG